MRPKKRDAYTGSRTTNLLRYFFGGHTSYIPDCFLTDFALEFDVDVVQYILEFECKKIFVDFGYFEVEAVLNDGLVVLFEAEYEAFFEFLDAFYGLNVNFKLDVDFLDIFFRVVDDFGCKNFVVWYKNEVVVVVKQSDFGDVDVDDFAFVLTDFNVIVDAEFFGERNDDAADNFAEIVFGNDGDCGCHNAERGKEGFVVDAHEGEEGH